MAKRDQENVPQVLGFLGIGLDGKDGHGRVTRADHFYLVGGSAETHERMQGTAIRFSEGLKHSGRKIHEATLEEIMELLYDSQD